MITDAQIANRLGISRQKVRYHRTRPESTKSRRCDTELAIERAKEELTKQLIQELQQQINGQTDDHGPIQTGRRHKSGKVAAKIPAAEI